MNWPVRAGLCILTLLAADGFCATLRVNGTCQVGNCASPDVVASGNTLSTAFNFMLTLSNSDQYRVIGNINSSNGPGDTLGIISPFTVTYLGNKTGTSSGADVITLDVLQNFQLGFTLRESTEFAGGGFSGPLANGSSVRIQLVVNGQSLPVMGPFFPPASFSFKSQAVSVAPTTSPLLDVLHTFTFAAGSGVGSTIYNALTPSGTLGGASTGTVCDSSSSDSSGCMIIACDGIGSTLPILRPGPSPRDTAGSGGNACSLVGFDGSGGTLPLLYPTGSGGTDNTPPVVTFQGACGDLACDGAGSSLPILYPTGPAGGSGGGSGNGPGALVAFDGAGSSLPIFRSPSGKHEAAAAPSSGFPIEIATPFETVAATYTVSANCINPVASCWLTVPVASGNIAASSRTAITTFFDGQGLAPGTYTANVGITITPQGQAASTINVPVTAAVAPPGPYLMLSQTGMQFQAAPGATSSATQTISLTNAGTGSLGFTASASSISGNWLSVSPSSGSITSGPAQVNIQANPTGLAPGVYSGLVQFGGSQVVNGTQTLEVTLTVSQAGQTPPVSSHALVFVAAAGSNPAPQTVQVVNAGPLTLTVNPGINFASGSGGWFTTSAPANTVSAGKPLAETVTVNSTNLPAGSYVGSVDLHFAETNTDQLVEVLLVVKPAQCSPARLLPVITNLGGGFQVNAGTPVPLAAQVVDDCGAPLNAGAVMAYFPGAEVGVPLIALGNGQWSGTWLPHQAVSGQATVALLATANSPVLYGSAGVRGTIGANSTAPLVFSGGVANSASFLHAPVAPGGRISIFGSNLGATAENDASPYQTTLGGTQVLLGGAAVPLQVTSAGQINAVAPDDLPLGAPQQLIVEQGGMYSMPESVVFAAAQPAVFTVNQSGQGPGAIVVVRPDGSYFVNGTANASAGDVLLIYCTGLGLVSPPVAAGTAAPTDSTSSAVAAVTVTIGGVPAPVSFAGLAPGFVGLYQVNATVPAGVSAGPNAPLTISAAGATSPPVTLAIQ